jgi:hypothetical protein
MITEGLGKNFEKQMKKITMDTLDPRDIDRSFPRFLEKSRPLVIASSKTYSLVSKNFIDNFTYAETGDKPKIPYDSYKVGFDNTSFTKRMAGSANFGYKHALGVKGLSMATLPPKNEIFKQVIQNTIRDAATQMLREGRDSVTSFSNNPSSKAFGYGRNTNDGACEFCEMLATRSDYRSEQSASFEAHRSCGCSPEPAFDGWTPPGDRPSQNPDGASEKPDGFGGVSASEAGDMLTEDTD